MAQHVPTARARRSSTAAVPSGHEQGWNSPTDSSSYKEINIPGLGTVHVPQQHKQQRGKISVDDFNLLIRNCQSSPGGPSPALLQQVRSALTGMPQQHKPPRSPAKAGSAPGRKPKTSTPKYNKNAEAEVLYASDFYNDDDDDSQSSDTLNMDLPSLSMDGEGPSAAGFSSVSSATRDSICSASSPTIASLLARVKGVESAPVGRKVPQSEGKAVTPWGQWFIAKEAALRAEMERRGKEEERLAVEKAREMLKKMEMQQRSSKQIQAWMELKKKEDKEKKVADKKKADDEAWKKLENKELLNEKLRNNYQLWSQKKLAEKKAKEEKEQRDKEEKEASKVAKRKKSEEEFKRWRQTISGKVRKTPSMTLAYRNGGLVGIYDLTSVPAPSYVNPEPWKGPLNDALDAPEKEEKEKPVLLKKAPGKVTVTLRRQPQARGNMSDVSVADKPRCACCKMNEQPTKARRGHSAHNGEVCRGCTWKLPPLNQKETKKPTIKKGGAKKT